MWNGLFTLLGPTSMAYSIQVEHCHPRLEFTQRHIQPSRLIMLKWQLQFCSNIHLSYFISSFHFTPGHLTSTFLSLLSNQTDKNLSKTFRRNKISREATAILLAKATTKKHRPYFPSLGIQSPNLRMVVEPKYYAFRRWLDILIMIWEYDWLDS